MLSRLWDNIRFFLGLAIVCWMVWVITTANAYGLSVLHIKVLEPILGIQQTYIYKYAISPQNIAIMFFVCKGLYRCWILQPLVAHFVRRVNKTLTGFIGDFKSSYFYRKHEEFLRTVGPCEYRGWYKSSLWVVSITYTTIYHSWFYYKIVVGNGTTVGGVIALVLQAILVVSVIFYITVRIVNHYYSTNVLGNLVSW
jgi:hypothetical protein